MFEILVQKSSKYLSILHTVEVRNKIRVKHSVFHRLHEKHFGLPCTCKLDREENIHKKREIWAKNMSNRFNKMSIKNLEFLWLNIIQTIVVQ